jgi:hypothetical protein
MKITDNFLPEKQFEELQSVMLSPWFPWFYGDYINYKGEKNSKHNFQFTHAFLQDNDKSNFYNLLNPLIDKINILSLLRVKANLGTITEKSVENKMHRDYELPFVTTGIFYLNNNNGYTKFEDGTKVESKANRFVEFNSQIKHAGVTQTDTNVRVLINLNYF